MLNHTYTSVKNANLVDCGKKQHIPSQPTPLLKENFLGEFRTELDKKKVLAALGIATELSLEWKNINGDVGDSPELMRELDARTTYSSDLHGMRKTIVEGIEHLESIVGGDKAKDDEQDQFINQLKEDLITLNGAVTSLSEDLSKVTDTDIPNLSSRIDAINTAINNITNLVAVSAKEDNALQLIAEEGYEGLYVPDLSSRVAQTEQDITSMDSRVSTIEEDLSSFVTKDDLGGDGTYDFIDKQTYEAHVKSVSSEISTIKGDLSNTVKTGEDGHVDTLFVNTISKDNDPGNIKITDSFEMESGIPLDVRFVVEDVQALCSLDVTVCYPGMAVVVKKLNSLYILKNPVEGVAFNQEYVSDDKNWKCPEDLVTMALTRTQYNELVDAGSINESVFYYIYEEEFTLTRPPRLEDYNDEELFQEAQDKWNKQVLELEQQYVSASWGLDIENKLSQKASAQSVTILREEISAIKGGGDGISLDSINNEVINLKETDSILEQRLDVILDTASESGRLVEVETQVAAVQQNLQSYVTKDELTGLSSGFNFVKPDEYAADKAAFIEALEAQVTTAAIELNGHSIAAQGGTLSIDTQALAMSSEVPEIKVMTRTNYEQLTPEEGVYYYTYDDEVTDESQIYVTQTEVNNKIQTLQSQLDKLTTSLNTLSTTVEELKNQLSVLA